MGGGPQAATVLTLSLQTCCCRHQRDTATQWTLCQPGDWEGCQSYFLPAEVKCVSLFTIDNLRDGPNPDPAGDGGGIRPVLSGILNKVPTCPANLPINFYFYCVDLHLWLNTDTLLSIFSKENLNEEKNRPESLESISMIRHWDSCIKLFILRIWKYWTEYRNIYFRGGLNIFKLFIWKMSYNLFCFKIFYSNFFWKEINTREYRMYLNLSQILFLCWGFQTGILWKPHSEDKCILNQSRSTDTFLSFCRLYKEGDGEVWNILTNFIRHHYAGFSLRRFKMIAQYKFVRTNSKSTSSET